MNKNIKALIHSKDDIRQLVYDPHTVDLGGLTKTIARAYPSNILVDYNEHDYDQTKLCIYRDGQEYLLYRRKEEKAKGGKT